MSKFLNNINLEAGNDIQFKTIAGANAGKIEQDGNNLVLSNATGDVLLGDGSSDVYIGDGINNVDILFEQSGSIKGDGSAITLTIGGANTTLNLENPNINGTLSLGATSINNKLTFTTANGYILFDHEPSGDTGAYEGAISVPLLKIDRGGTEKTILERVSEQGGLLLGADDSVIIAAGDTRTVLRTNLNEAEETVVFASEGGFKAYGFPSNDTTWSNRNEFRFRSDSATASENGLYIGDGSSTQFIDLSRNLKNISSLTVGAASPDSGVELQVTGHSKFKGDSYHSHFNYSTDQHTYIRGGKAGAEVYINDTHNSNVGIASGGGNVGIGTNSPSAKLDVRYDSSKDGIFVKDEGGGAVMLFGADGSNNARARFYNGSHSQNIEINSNAGSPTYFNAGNVGIGTTSPNEKLEVNGSVRVGNVKIQNANGGRIGLNRNTSTGAIYNNTFGAFQIQNNSTTGFEIQGYNTGGGLTGLISMKQSDGYVGIGIASPTTKFHIDDNATSGTGLLVTGGGVGNALATFTRDVGGSGSVQINSNSSRPQIKFAASSNTFALGVNGSTFEIADNTGLGTNARLSINSSGNVGIGTTSPDHKLHIESTGWDGLRIESTTTSGAVLDLINTQRRFSIASRDNSFQVRDITASDTPRLTIKSDGKVGIGTASPSELLEVSSNTGAADGTTNPTTIRISDTDNGSAWDTTNSFANLDFYSADSSGSGAGTKARVGAIAENSTGAQIGLAFSTTNSTDGITEKVRIDSTGNVGIGTTSPDEFSIGNAYRYLAVGGDKPAILNLIDDGTNGSYLQFGTAAGLRRSSIHTLNGSHLVFAVNNSNSGVNLTEAMRIASGGNVGIGTTSPSTRLEVAASATTGVDIAHFSNSNDVVKIKHALDGVGSGVTSIFDASNNEDIRLSAQSDSWFNGGNVGIGTITPSQKLSVAGSIDAITAMGVAGQWASSQIRLETTDTVDTTGWQGISFDSSTAPNYGWSIGVNRSFSGRGSFRFYEHINSATGAERFTIEQDGNVGIGATTPENKLHILTSTTDTSSQLMVQNGSSGDAAIKFNIDGQSNVIGIDNSDGNKFKISGFSALGTYDRLTIDTSGNVGIGTNSPDQKLVVATDQGTTFSDAFLALKADTVTNTVGRTAISLATSTVNNFGVTLNGIRQGSASGEPRFGINMHNNSAGGVEALSIRASGNVGIGETAPEVKLEVAGDILAKDSFVSAGATASQGYTFHDFGTGWGYKGVQSPSRLAMFTASAERVTIDSNGNVGIGTTSPEVKLHVGTSTLGTSPDTSADIISSGGITIEDGKRLSFDTDYYVHANMKYNSSNPVSEGRLEIQGYYGINFITRGTSRIIIKGNTGFVGIGITSPATKFHVEGDPISTGVLAKFKGSSGYGSLLQFDRGDSYNWKAGIGGGSASAGVPSSYFGIVETANTPRLVIAHTTGNVGIGTTNPSHLLHVYAADGVAVDSYISLVQNAEATAGDNFGLKVQAGRNSSDVTMEVSNAVGTSYMRVRGDGNVGIGTVSPSTKLDVTSGAVNDARIRVKTGDSNAGAYFQARSGTDGFYGLELYHQSTAKWFIGGYGVNRLGFFVGEKSTAANEKMSLTTSGNVGIGTTNPAQKLHVNGNVDIDNGGILLQQAYGINFGVSGYDIVMPTTTRLGIKTAGTERITILNTGNVGIGTTSPTEKLHVEGNLELTSSFEIGSNSGSYWQRIRTEDAVASTTNAFNFETRNGSGSFIKHMVIRNDGNVGIGVTNPSYALQVGGSIVGTSKSFIIDHPTKEGKKLLHACIEGPEAAVYFRGKSTSNIIEMPDYWIGLVDIDTMTVDITPWGPNQDIYVESIADDGEITIGANTEEPLNYFYVVYGERKDIDKLEIEVVGPEYSG
jgi:hypothetical protein